jgi:hypothetical protein
VSEHLTLPVHGYRPQGQGAVDLANRAKELEALVITFLNELDHMAYRSELISEHVPGAPGVVARRHQVQTGVVDPRGLAIARTQIETAFMWMVRSVFQPTPAALPEEVTVDEITYAKRGDAPDPGRSPARSGGPKDGVPQG